MPKLVIPLPDNDAAFLSTAAAAAALAGVPIETLNSQCFCISLDKDALRETLESTLGQPGLFELVQQRCPHLFAAHPVFIAPAHLDRMAQVVRAVESVVALPAYREEVLAHSPAIARHDPGGAKGVFFGYDFHVTQNNFGLIEIHTNAGGAMLNAVLSRAQHACCPAIEQLLPPSRRAEVIESSISAMFRQEWSQYGRDKPLRSIAIVDETPKQQYLYPEFLLFQQLFQRNGIEAVIVDPSELSLRDGQLWHEQLAIDMVYNRLTDFSLEAVGNATLRQAYLERATLLTPHPQAHALYADKRNLALLCDAQRLNAWKVPQATQDLLLTSIPHTEVITAEDAEYLWRGRRAAYRRGTVDGRTFAGYKARNSRSEFSDWPILRFTAAQACCGQCRNGRDSGRIWMRLDLTGQYSQRHPYAGAP